MRNTFTVLLTCLALTACAYETPGGDPVVSPRLDSGVTSSNGGGQRALGNTLDVGVSNGATTIRRGNNAQGSAY